MKMQTSMSEEQFKMVLMRITKMLNQEGKSIDEINLLLADASQLTDFNTELVSIRRMNFIKTISRLINSDLIGFCNLPEIESEDEYEIESEDEYGNESEFDNP